MTANLFAMHSENLRAVGDVFDRVLALSRDAIRSRDETAERDLTLSAALLLGMKLEVRLAKLLREPGGFTTEECNQILGQRRQGDRWARAIDMGFRRRHNTWYLDEGSIGVDAVRRLQLMQSAFAEHLEPVIGMRNTLAHGQWIYPLNSKESATNPEMANAISREWVQSLSIKDRLAQHYCQMLGDLVSTETAFERDFETTYLKFTETLYNLVGADAAAYRSDLRARHERGLRRRRASAVVAQDE